MLTRKLNRLTGQPLFVLVLLLMGVPAALLALGCGPAKDAEPKGAMPLPGIDDTSEPRLIVLVMKIVF